LEAHLDLLTVSPRRGGDLLAVSPNLSSHRHHAAGRRTAPPSVVPGDRIDAEKLAGSDHDGVGPGLHLDDITGFATGCRLAEAQAASMAKRDKLDHNTGKPFVARLKASGYDAKIAAENIGAGYHTLAEAFSGWRDSAPHRANMLLAGATRIGIAAIYTPASKYKVYWALILAEPDDKKG